MIIVNKRLFLITLVIILIVVNIGVFWKTVMATKSEIYSILVDVEESKMYVFKNNKLEKVYPCAGGKTSTPSPIGTWTIVSKGMWGEGFGGRFMGINCPWGQFGIHGTTELYSVGWNSSHGCIRMNNNEVKELYEYIPIGTKVIIVDGVYGNFGRGFRYLESGMYGADVYEIQNRLKELGFFNSQPNGKFGKETEISVQKYCRANNLYVRKTISPELQQHMGFKLID